MKEESKGLYLALLLSMVIIFAVNYLFPATPVETADAEQLNAPTVEESLSSSPAENEIQNTVADDEEAPEEELVALPDDPRVMINTPALQGSINLKGARLDSLNLIKYKQTLEQDSPFVELLLPAGSNAPYFVQNGWLSSDPNLKLPTAESIWTAKSEALTPQSPLTLEYDNGEGLRFIRVISVDENYLFTVQDTVENNTANPVVLYPYGLISRTFGADETQSRSVVHEGISGVINGSLKEIKLSSLKEGKPEAFESTGAWAGFSDRYWFTAFILNADTKNALKFSKISEKSYQADYRGAPMTIASGSASSQLTRFFAGAKEIKLLDAYKENQKIEKFDLAVDFGWYYFLTKPFFFILDFLYNIIGNMGWAILLFAALLRLAMFPIANKSYESMSKMKKLQPKIMDIQQKYKDNKMLQQQATMELYKREKINPASGCLPMFIQIPVFFSLYKVLNISLEIRHAPFIGWIKDLSAPDPLTISTWSHIPLPAFIDVGVWPILMGFTMWFQQKLNPAPANKDQARMFAMLPLIFTFMLGHFASGLVIYWTLSNLLSIVQQKAIMRKNGVK